MVFSMAELRQELQALGYGALPDDFIVSSLSQLQLDVPQSWEKVEKKGGGSSSRGPRGAGKSSRQEHGSPVPGDREYATAMKSAIRGKKELGSAAAPLRMGGLDSVCFTPDFATELDEMRKMLKIMQGTKEQLFGSSSTQKSNSKGVGLADEHERYVGNLLDQWRLVGRTIRSRRRECAKVDVGAEVLKIPNTTSAASNSETSRYHQLDQHQTSFVNSQSRRRQWQKPPDAFVVSYIQAPAEMPSTSCGGPERCDLEAEKSALPEDVNERIRSAEAECSMGKAGTDDHQDESTATGGITERDGNEGDLNGGLKGGTGNDSMGPVFTRQESSMGPVFTRQESSSAISPGVSYQQGGMLYPENFTLDHPHSKPSDLSGDANEKILLQSGGLDVFDAQAEHDPGCTSPHSSSAQTPKAVPEKPPLAPSQDHFFLAAFQKSLDDLDPQDVIDQETFANVTQKISDTAVSPISTPVSRRQCLAQQPVAESENPLDSGVPPALMRTPDRRGGGGYGGGAHQSPLNDRSNMRIAEDEDPEALSHSRTKLKAKTESTSPASAAPKRNSAVTLKRSRSSRGPSRRDEIGEEATGTHLSDIVEGGGQVDSHLLSENRTPPPSARKFKSERALRHSLSEKSISPRVTIRNKGVVDPSDLDIPSLGLSPIRIREQSASPLNHLLSSRERSCGANGYSEHRLGSHCSACHPTPPPPPPAPLRKSGDGNSQSTTIRSPFGKSNAETVLSETEASPQQKRPAVRKEAKGWSLAKQKLPWQKSTAAPSGIYTPLVDPKKDDVNNNTSKVLLKTRRLASSMDFSSDSSRLTDRRAPSLRSSTESTRSSGPQRGASSQSQVSKSNSGSSPYAKSSSFGSRSSTPKDTLSSPFGKSSSFGSFGSRSATAKDPLTPGGPRRGGKVDRVARFAEMQNLWKNDTFLKTSSKRKPQSFHRIFARLHLSHERCTAAYRERVLEEMRPSTEQPPFVVPTLYSNSEGVCIF